MLCSEILPVLCTVLDPGALRRPQVDEGVGGTDTACRHTSCQGHRGSTSIPMNPCLLLTVSCSLVCPQRRPSQAVCGPWPHAPTSEIQGSCPESSAVSSSLGSVSLSPGRWNIHPAQLRSHSTQVAGLGRGLALGPGEPPGPLCRVRSARS